MISTGAHHGQRDLEELLNLGGAVQTGGLVVAFGIVLDAGQQQNRVVSDGAPDGNHRAGREHQGGIGQPVDLGSDHLIDDSVLGVENPFPNHGDGRRGHHHGQKVDGPECGLSLYFGV